MRRIPASLVVLGMGAALGLCACDSGNGSSRPPVGPDRTAGVSAACALPHPPVSQASPVTSADAKRVKGKVGVVLPRESPANRDTSLDPVLLTKALRRTGLHPVVEMVGSDPSEVSSVAHQLIGDGVEVLIVDSIDTASGVRLEKAAERAGIQVIDYDRFNPGGRASYYVSFDAEDIGRLQAQTMAECLAQQGVTDPKVIVLNGGTDVDDNAVLMAKGVHDALDPLVTAGRARIEGEASVTGWQVARAVPAFTQALAAAGGRVDAVLAANDAIAGAVIDVLRKIELTDSVVVTGQGSGVEGVRAVVAGRQSMTAFTDVNLEADAVAQLAAALVSGQDPASRGLTLTPFDDPLVSSHQLQAVLLPAEVVTQANVSDVVQGGALDLADLCRGILGRCAALGVD